MGEYEKGQVLIKVNLFWYLARKHEFFESPRKSGKKKAPPALCFGLMPLLEILKLHLMWRVDSLEKTLMLGGIGGRRRRGRQDEMAGWHHWLDGRESRWTPGVGDGQGGLVCWNSWGCKALDTTERLNWCLGREPGQLVRWNELFVI